MNECACCNVERHETAAVPVSVTNCLGEKVVTEQNRFLNTESLMNKSPPLIHKEPLGSESKTVLSVRQVGAKLVVGDVPKISKGSSPDSLAPLLVGKCATGGIFDIEMFLGTEAMAVRLRMRGPRILFVYPR